ncbi:MAG: response regulator [Candidatus Rokubacteria bacterium]|nr:response regulator [Candidatus Rokubacteria bacterium]
MKNQKLSKQPPLSSSLTTGKAARHCQVSTPGLRRWIREGRLRVFRTPGGHCRIELAEFQRFLREYGLPPYPGEPPETRILIADDEPRTVAHLVEFLATDPRGFKVETATDGYEALIKVGAFQPSILILDVVMPQLNGMEVCRRIKTDPQTRGIRILGITGYPETIPGLLAAGADACLAKPIRLRQIQQELERLLAAVRTR